MPNRITTQQLFDQYIQMNQKLESMEEKLNSVIENNSINTRLTGSIVENNRMNVNKNKFVIETIANAITIPPNTLDSRIQMGLDGTESEVYIWINIDTFPWRIYTNYAELISGSDSHTTYPTFINVQEAYPNIPDPAKAFFIGHRVGNYEIENFEMAKEIPLYYPEADLRVQNRNETENATVTIRIVRVWR